MHFALLLLCLLLTGSAQPIPGVHVPLPIDPVVTITTGVWLTYLYPLILRREADPVGFRTNFLDMTQNGMSQQVIYNAFISSPEWTSNPALADRTAYVVALYKTLLLRGPSSSEIAEQLADLSNADGSGGGMSWPDKMNTFYGCALELVCCRFFTKHFARVCANMCAGRLNSKTLTVKLAIIRLVLP